MTVPTTYIRYIAGTDGAPLNDFTPPGLTRAGAPVSDTISDYEVLVDGVPTTGYSITGGGLMQFTSDLTVGQALDIKRITPIADSLVTYPVPTRYTPRSHNLSLTQLLYSIQELWNQFAGYLGLSGNTWDFLDYRGVNLGDPISSSDVAHKEYVDDSLELAKAYTRSYVHAYWPTSVEIAAGTQLVPITVQVAAGVTPRIWLPVRAAHVMVVYNGGIQSGATDYTHVPNTNYIDLLFNLVLPSSFQIIAIVGSGASVEFEEETQVVSAKTTTVTFTEGFEVGFLAINGVLKSLGIDYTHVAGSDSVTLLFPPVVPSRVTLIKVLEV